jgi:hypothetical protein
MLDHFLARLRREIVDETVHHIRRLVPVTRRCRRRNFRADRVLEAVRRLIVSSDFRRCRSTSTMLVRRGTIGGRAARAGTS